VSVQEQVEAVVADAPGTFGIYARNVGTGEIVDVNAHRVMNTESAAKVFILLYYRRLVESGVCDPAQRIELTDDNRYWGTGVLRYLGGGIQPTLDDLAWLMVIVSDNVATAMLLQAIGDQATVNAAMHELGLESAQLNPSITVETAMAGEAFATATPLRVYNKPGNGLGTCIDSGLFETTKASWVVAAMASEQPDFASRPDDVAPQVFARIGELLYDAWGEVAPV
jgi:hypothetical protein